MKKSVLLICIAALVLTSCENFLKGSNVRNELEEVIEIANASPMQNISDIELFSKIIQITLKIQQQQQQARTELKNLAGVC